MLATVHVAAGALIGRVVPDPYIASALSFVSHYFLDAVPHFKWKQIPLKKNGKYQKHAFRHLWYEAIEPVFAVLLAVYLIGVTPPEIRLNVFLGIAFNQIPDLLVFLEWKYGIKRPFPIRQIEDATHRHSISFMGVFNQVLVFIPIMLYLLK